MNEEQLIDWVVQVAIFATVCPMLLALLYYVWRPGGRIVRGMVVTNKEDQARQQANRLLVQLLSDHHGGGPVGLETLAAALGDDPVTLETVVEPFLLQQGLLMRTPRGRMVTDAARSHLAEAA